MASSLCKCPWVLTETNINKKFGLLDGYRSAQQPEEVVQEWGQEPWGLEPALKALGLNVAWTHNYLCCRQVFSRTLHLISHQFHNARGKGVCSLRCTENSWGRALIGLAEGPCPLQGHFLEIGVAIPGPAGPFAHAETGSTGEGLGWRRA